MKSIASHVSDTWLLYSGTMVWTIAWAYVTYSRTCRQGYSDWRAHIIYLLRSWLPWLGHLSSSGNFPVCVYQSQILVRALLQKVQYNRLLMKLVLIFSQWGKLPGKWWPQCSSVEQALGPVFQMEPEPGLLERLQRTSCNLDRCPLWLVVCICLCLTTSCQKPVKSFAWFVWIRNS